VSEFYEDLRGVEARRRMLSAVADQLGHDQFTGSSFLELLSLLELGASTMVEEGRLGDDDLDEAERNARTLLETLNEARDGFGLEYFTEQTVYEARLRLCPGFWPFC
jgi:hypothetical protein